ncbi:MAG: hypothetical protein RL497_57 [Pseudomonadota bacterium]|jgi:hypothetical protein
MQLNLFFRLAVLAFGLNAPCWAEQIIVPVGSQQGTQVKLPPKGMSMSQVQAQYGEPEHKSGPVGQPPISVWDYPSFTVYFEHQHTIHGVVKHVPQPQAAPVAPVAPVPAPEAVDEDMEE